MVDLRRTPSIQHTAALIGSSVEETLLNFRALDAAEVHFTLEPGRRLIKPLMEGQSEEWALGQIALERKKLTRSVNANLIKAFAPYARGKAVRWFRAFPKDLFPLSAGIVIPLNPSGFWYEDGKFKVLWVQAWKGRTLDPLQRAIFHTILSRRVFAGDFSDAELEWVDLRERQPGKGRDIEILGRSDFGVLTDTELKQYLQILLDAFVIYSEEKRSRREEEKRSRPPAALPLFDQEKL